MMSPLKMTCAASTAPTGPSSRSPSSFLTSSMATHARPVATALACASASAVAVAMCSAVAVASASRVFVTPPLVALATALLVALASAVADFSTLPEAAACVLRTSISAQASPESAYSLRHLLPPPGSQWSSGAHGRQEAGTAPGWKYLVLVFSSFLQVRPSWQTNAWCSSGKKPHSYPRPPLATHDLRRQCQKKPSSQRQSLELFEAIDDMWSILKSTCSGSAPRAASAC
mmetsp:Transcript_50217/g.129464  ORF Transcript_50217/g.129464 Transcript_50217/m.129464 type:complete len:230 (-) Transcript_50217:211-900(-)